MSRTSREKCTSWRRDVSRADDELHLILGNALADRDDLIVFLSPADVVLGPESLVQPDLFIISKEPGRHLASWSEIGIPILAVEILSPSTAARDRGKKRRTYQKAGIAEYWIIDSDARLAERWMPNDERPEIVDGSLEWLAPAGQGVSVDFPTIFRRALGPM